VKLTLLVDMDGTLLDIDKKEFLAGYLQAFGQHVSDRFDPETFTKALLDGTVKMVLNNRPDRTLKEVFDSYFYPALGVEEEDIRDLIERFYVEKYSRLREITKERSEAVKLVEEAVRRGYQVVIATNPLFPKTALQQRLEWAGLDPENGQIALLPSYETFHFVKPNPVFFAECLALLGWPEGPVVMVGNDFQADIFPAQKIGLPTFYTPDASQPALESGLDSGPAGSIEDVLPWIDSQDPEDLTPDFESSQALMSILASTPAALQTLALEFPEEAWNYCPFPGEWCIAEIVCHLRDVDAEVNLPRLEKMLSEANPFIPGMDTDAWVSERQYIDQDCLEALTSFIHNRIQLLDLLERLQPEEWDRPARHAIFGPTHLKEMVKIIAGHDRMHIQQIHKTLPARTDQV
jgi:FMN phosphatase YigB (HAD superfamily)